MARGTIEGIEVASNRRRPVAASATPAARAGRVLVIEDEHDVAELIRYNLGKEGYEVQGAANGPDGLTRARVFHVARLRAKVTAANLPPLAIETVRGVGSRFREAE